MVGRSWQRPVLARQAYRVIRLCEASNPCSVDVAKTFLCLLGSGGGLQYLAANFVLALEHLKGHNLSTPQAPSKSVMCGEAWPPNSRCLQMCA